MKFFVALLAAELSEVIALIQAPFCTSDNASELPESPPEKPALLLTFSAVLNTSTSGVQEVSANATRLAVSIRELGAEARDGMILDFARGRRFSHQRFFEETVCYELDLSSNHQSPETLEQLEGNSNSSGVAATELQQASFLAAVGQAVGAPLELYDAAVAAPGCAWREIAGQRCHTWVANRTLRQPVARLAEDGGLLRREMGWRAPSPVAVRLALEAAEGNRSSAPVHNKSESEAEAVITETAAFCVAAQGEVLAASSSRRLSVEMPGLPGSLTLWEHSEQSSATAAPSLSPSSQDFEERRGVAGGHCVDLTEGSTGPSELGTPLNAKERLDRINGEAGGHWEAGPYQLWEQTTVAEVRSALGTELRPLQLPLWKDLAAEVLVAGGRRAGGLKSPSLPRLFDARKHWPHCISIGTVRNQGACGSCWAFAASAVLADRFCVSATAVDEALSPQTAGRAAGGAALLEGQAVRRFGGLALAPEHLVDCDSKNAGCSGGRLDDAWQYLRERGVPAESCSPYRFCPAPNSPNCGGPRSVPFAAVASNGSCAGMCTGGGANNGPAQFFRALAVYAVALPGDVRALQHELLANGPVQVGFFVFSDFHNYRRGVYFRTPGAYGPLGGHAVRLIGWGSMPVPGDAEVSYWLAANSWSPTWGTGGFFRIRRGTNECGIETTPAAGLPDLNMDFSWHQEL